MERLDWTKKFRWYILGLRVQGLWPPGKKSYGFHPYTLYMIVSISLFHSTFIFSKAMKLYFVRNDLKAVTGIIFIMTTDFAGYLKAFGLIKNMKYLKKLMVWVESDSFQPKNEQQKKMVLPNLRLWETVTFIYWAPCWIFIIMTALNPILDKSYKDHRLPFICWYPFDYTSSPIYEVTYFFQILSFIFVGLTNITIDSMVAFFNMCLGSQCDILCDDLKNLRETTKTSPEEANIKLKKCIMYHKQLLEFVNNANQFYNFLVLVQFFTSGLTIGLSLFQLSIVEPLSIEFNNLAIYAIATFMEILIYCWFGNEVYLKSSRLSYAAYEAEWIGLPLAVQKNLLIFVLRLQKPIQISAFGLFYLSLETFVKILRTSWSYFALLRQVNQPQK